MRRMRVPIALAAVALGAATAAPLAGQGRLYVRDQGPGPSGRLIREALQSPYELIVATDTARLRLRRDSTVSSTIIVLGRNVAVGARVNGDVIVIGGDLFVHPGAFITGRALAVGGCVYPSALATISGGTACWRDHTFDAVETDRGIALDYRALGHQEPLRFISLPVIYGVRVPSYDRVNGLSAGVGPRLTPLGAALAGRLTIDPVVTYRSHLGEFDPSVVVRYDQSRRAAFELSALRGTFTNDAWIRGDIVNSVLTLVTGKDVRNYYRADRGEARLIRLWEGEKFEHEPFVGARTERGWPVGPTPSAVSEPWSAFGRDDREEGALRPNPPVQRGRISSGLLGSTLRWESGDVKVTSNALVEVPFQNSLGRDFVQGTLDVAVGFPTFGLQRFSFEAHGVLTLGDTAPAQRFAYLGGSGTLPTFDVLEFGGDQLLFTESRYSIPIEKIIIPLLGSPTFTIRHMLGAAGAGGLPRLEQNIGVRLSIFAIKVDYTVDPRTRDTDFSVGVAVGR